ncbi:MAG TPA: ATP-binding cassette domain-containing protein [Jiangellaceae bacterium]|nr:ATP-binding cassette domain-containing protein [Jiangellaceae bacterium]
MDGANPPREPTASNGVVLELNDISKSFGGVRVLRDVSLQLRKGEVLGLVGDNGAGKSTLIKIVMGVHRPDAGTIAFAGREFEDLTVQKARALGVETVYQERALAEQLSMWRNIFMGRPISAPLGFLNVRKMRRITAQLMGESMGFTSAALTPDTHVSGLSGGERQGLAIVRALHFQANIIILDEPTMGLSLGETDKFLSFIRGIRTAGKSAIFIDHNIFHVYSVADRIVLLDRGRIAGEFPTTRYSLDELTEIMRQVAATGSLIEPERRRAAQAASEADLSGGTP